MGAELLCLLLFATVCLLLLAGYPVALTLAGTSLVFAVFGAAVGLFHLQILSAFPQRIFAIMTNEVLVAVPLFVFMGVLLERCRVAEAWLRDMGKLFGELPGGLGYSVCIVGALMAASTGIVGATVVTMGLLSLPAMLRGGYCQRLTCGVVCASGTLGQIIPPSIILVLLGDQLSSAYQQAQFNMGDFSPDTVSVNDLFAGALLPGLTLVGLYLIYLAVIAVCQPHRCPPVRNETKLPYRRIVTQALSALAAPLLLIVAVLGSILGGLASPTEAAGVGAIGALLLAGYRVMPQRGLPMILAVVAFAGLLLLTVFVDLRMQRTVVSDAEWLAIATALLLAGVLVYGVGIAIWRVFCRPDDTDGGSTLFAAMRMTAMVSAMVFFILIGASMFSLVFRGFGGDEMVEALLTSLPGGTITVLFLVMLLMFLLGFILDFLEIVFIVVPIVAPVLLMMEIAPGQFIHPVWLGVMMAMNLQTSFLTPPFGFSLFYLRGVAPPQLPTVAMYRGVVPFIGLQLLMLLVLWFFPGLATWLPAAVYG